MLAVAILVSASAVYSATIDRDQISKNEIQPICATISPGVYSAGPPHSTLHIRIDTESVLTVFRRDASFISHSTKVGYTIYPNCSMTIDPSDDANFQRLFADISWVTFVGTVSSHITFKYLPHENRIKLGNLYFTLQEEAPTKHTCSVLEQGYYVNHIDGITAVIRVVNGTHMVPMIILPLALERGAEHLTSSIIRYKVKPDCTLLVNEDHNSKFFFFMSITSRIGGLEDESHFSIAYCPETVKIRVGTLTLDLNR